MSARFYGRTTGGAAVDEHLLSNRNGMIVRFLSLGGIVTAIETADRGGRRANVVLGLPDLAAYEERGDAYYFGGIIGRYAGRIAGARFELHGRSVALEANEGANTLHGGGRGFHARTWHVERIGEAAARLTLHSPDGDQGFPGALDVEATYCLTDDDIFEISFSAQADAATAINLTSHIYFNLAGAGAASVRDHRLQVAGVWRVATGVDGLPSGAFVETRETPFDFARPRRIGDGLEAAMPRILGHVGYDHSWLVPQGTAGETVHAVRLGDPASGRVLDVSTTAPSVHLYTANHFDGGDIGAHGRPLIAQDGIAIEAQGLSDSVHHPNFPSTLLRPGETYRSRTLYAFGVEGGA